MSKIRDFNLVKASDISTNATNTNTNSVNVVVNADTSGSNNQIPANQGVNFTSTPTPTSQLGVTYPPETQTNVAYASVLPREATVNLPVNTEETDRLNQELEFYKLLSSILSSILKDNNPKLIINLVVYRWR